MPYTFWFHVWSWKEWNQAFFWPMILTSLHPPGAAYCTQPSCQEHRCVPSLFSETSPSANKRTLEHSVAECSSFSEMVRRGYLSFQRLTELCSCQGALTTLQVLDHHLAEPIAHVHLNKQTRVASGFGSNVPYFNNSWGIHSSKVSFSHLLKVKLKVMNTKLRT